MESLCTDDRNPRESHPGFDGDETLVKSFVSLPLGIQSCKLSDTDLVINFTNDQGLSDTLDLEGKSKTEEPSLEKISIVSHSLCEDSAGIGAVWRR